LQSSANQSPSFGASSSSYNDEANVSNTSFASSPSFTAGVASLSLLQHLHRESNTPPLSPSEQPPRSREGPPERKSSFQSSPLKRSTSPAVSPSHSNPFTTPPTSPTIQPKTELEELFDIQNESSDSQFELEMKAMGDFTSIDSTSYDFLDFNV
jgi:regulatory protein SWI5